MVDVLKDFFEASSVIDLIYIAITIWSLISCYRKGFVLSILSMAKWLLAYVITLILFPHNLLDTFAILNLFIGIIVDAMQQISSDGKDVKKVSEEEMYKKIVSLEKQLKEIKNILNKK